MAPHSRRAVGKPRKRARARVNLGRIGYNINVDKECHMKSQNALVLAAVITVVLFAAWAVLSMPPC